MTIIRAPLRQVSGSPVYLPDALPLYRGGVAAGGGGGAFTPASIAGIVDYFVYDDLTRIKQSSDGTGAVTSAGDPVGWWRGQLDVITGTQPDPGSKAVYRATGLEFGYIGYIDAPYAVGCGSAITIAMAYNTGTTGAGVGASIVTRDVDPHNGYYPGGGASTRTYAKGGENNATDGSASLTGRIRRIYRFNGTTATMIVNGGAPVSLSTVGAITENSNILRMFLNLNNPSDLKAVCCAIYSTSISDEDATALDSQWLETYP